VPVKSILKVQLVSSKAEKDMGSGKKGNGKKKTVIGIMGSNWHLYRK